MRKNSFFILVFVLCIGICIGVGINNDPQSKKISTSTQVPSTSSFSRSMVDSISSIASILQPSNDSSSENKKDTLASGKNVEKHEYIGNKKSKKFHKPSCSSVKQMNESNKVYLNCTREEAIAKGYDPCGRCHP